MSLSLSNKQLDGEFSAGKDLALEITAGESIIWPTGAIEDDPERLILTIQTTEANQVVNLGYTFGQWKGPEYSKTRVNGRVKWESDGKTYRFYGKEGTSETDHNPLVHTYANAGEHQIIIAGKVRWCSCYYYDVEGVLPQEHSIANFLTKIEIGSRATSPIFDFTGRAFSMCKKIVTVPNGLLDKCTETQNADGIFYYCDGLTSVPANLFDYCTSITNFRGAFGHCIKLTTVPAHLFDKNTKVTVNGFEILFFDCSLFNSIPEDLFKYNTEVTSFFNTFQNCAITTIPNNLFNTNTKVTKFEGCFEGCTKLTTIPNNLFDKCTLVTNFKNCFHNCSALKSIPAALFTYNTTVTDFTQTFYNCTQVTGVLPTIWDSHKTTATNHSLCFCGCNKATNYNKAVIAGWGCANEGAMILTIQTTQANQVVNLGYNLGQFTGTSHGFTNNGQLDWGEGNPVAITENMGTSSSSLKHTYSTAGTHTITITGVIKWNYDYTPSQEETADGLHKVLTKIEIPSGCISPIYDISQYGFYNCKLLTAIPGNLFDNCTKTTDFKGTFENCTTLSAIPDKLFDKCTAISILHVCFKHCDVVKSIPAGLFSKLTNLTMVDGLFHFCAGITTIPTGLFSNNTKITDFGYVFAATKISTIPNNIFDAATQATLFDHVFASCTSLTTVQSTLFAKNTLATNFEYAFNGCTKLSTIPNGLFDNNTKVTDVSYCFQNCSTIKSIPSSLFTKNTAITKFDYCFANCTAINTALPTLWTSHGSASHTNCFCGCNNATNYTEANLKGWACLHISTFSSIPYMILEIKTTAANQKVNLGYNLGSWIEYTNVSNTSKETKPTTTVNGKLDWCDGTAVVSFSGSEGYADSSKLVHTYAKAGKHIIAVGGTINWGGMGYTNTGYGVGQTEDGLHNFLKSIKLPTSNSPINNINSFGFFNCTQLTSVPAGLIDKCTKSISVIAIFENCPITTLDGNFFAKLTSLIDCAEAFCNTKISSINTNWFTKNTKLQCMNLLFKGCVNITSISKDIFKNYPELWTISSIFAGTSITSIPENIFDGLERSKVTTLGSVFANTKITTFPTNLFGRSYLKVVGYYNIFANCKQLKTLPARMIPSTNGLLKDTNVGGPSLQGTFQNCTALTTIPSTFFDNLPASRNRNTTFQQTFYNCSGLTTLPELWKRWPYPSVHIAHPYYHGDCFTGCTKASNLQEAIKQGWASA